ncbi:asparagine synthase-related protein [Pseudactinotalea sp. Z1732]|uniref:asparagine synthase-related protein n=1 Tax=Pseudactinotalea sp. Z1732 TaxID=3413026 RepID=UPI003C7DD565
MSYYRPNDKEISRNVVTGLQRRRPFPRSAARHPFEALKSTIERAADGRVVYVTFSGGRDSSGILAAAVSLAQERRIPAAVPFTYVYPGLDESDETEWQELVVKHLGVQDWMRLEVVDGENEYLGPRGSQSLLRRGLVFPAAAHLWADMFERTAGGLVLTGEGGDDVFLPKRASALVAGVRGRFRPGSPRREALWSLAPERVRRRRARGASMLDMPWLTDSARREFLSDALRDQVHEPLSLRGGLEVLCSARFRGAYGQTMTTIAAEYGSVVADPFWHPQFLASYSRHAPYFGYADRTEAMTAVFGRVLPGEVLSRASKARFNTAYFGRSTREFARDWNGTGVDSELVDVEKLRQAWLADLVPALVVLLLQQAWLAQQTGVPSADRGEEGRRAPQVA